jgi:D-alanine-D-alanine ligase
VSGRQSARRGVIRHGPVPGGAPPDEQVTRVQVEEIRRHLQAMGYAVATRGVGLDLRPLAALARGEGLRVVNLVETIGGSSRLAHLVPAVLEAHGIRFTGCPSAAIAMCDDKLRMKRQARAAGLQTPDWLEDAPGAGPADPAGRYIVKAVHEHASCGLDEGSVVPTDAIGGRLDAMRRRHGGLWLAERFVDGREFNLSLIGPADGPELLPIAEIDFRDFPPGRAPIVDYAAKWDPEAPAYKGTQRTFAARPGDAELRRRLGLMALAAWSLFGLAGYARVDFRVDAAGEPWLVDVNANPCLTADAGFMAAAAEASLEPRDVLRRIVEAAPALVTG